MRYCEVIFTCRGGEDWQKDLLIQDLAALGFDSFEDNGDGFKGYLPAAQFDAAALDQLLIGQPMGFLVDYECREIKPENWNKVWESNFSPLTIADRCHVRATFHEARPDYPLEIVIDPKMAFGTGHHQTTAMMMKYILNLKNLQDSSVKNLQGSSVLDMGCGTGILAILAAKLGANPILAIDNDPVCTESTQENAQLNNIQNIFTKTGSVESIDGKSFDFIFANINRNILLEHLASYSNAMKIGSVLLISGFYEKNDLEIIRNQALTFGLEYENHQTDGEWASAQFIKK